MRFRRMAFAQATGAAVTLGVAQEHALARSGDECAKGDIILAAKRLGPEGSPPDGAVPPSSTVVAKLAPSAPGTPVEGEGDDASSSSSGHAHSIGSANAAA
eukprot:CAMPEP_0115762800 /NCGR_PEP_ID=MMETSP0272-20121206/101212_1 /TAXON_ID=71861 /ORGANISM="Scrippsiella trochoidea, Strain CCMP3099" /LENGTH=100 /DNA_ID=CAMNT_0003208529 /DNA_START=390 /DNA_END=690 /DNA_ORIENTATION=-